MILRRALLYSKGFFVSLTCAFFTAFGRLVRAILMIDKRDTLKLADIKKSEASYLFPELKKNDLSADEAGTAVKACPTGALFTKNKKIMLNIAECIRCAECKNACEKGAIEMSYSGGTTFGTREDMTICFLEN